MKELINKKSKKYHSLILLESRLEEIKKKSLHGTISEEQNQLWRNQIRESLIDLINTIEEVDVEENNEQSPQNIKTSSILPQQNL